MSLTEWKYRRELHSLYKLWKAGIIDKETYFQKRSKLIEEWEEPKRDV